MKKIICAVLAYVCVLSVAQSQVTSVQIKVREKSGFLGMGPPRFIELQLSNQNRQLPLTSDNVNAGTYYYFLVRSTGGWNLDNDFVKEDLPNLTFYQQGRKFAIVWKGEVQHKDTTSYLLLGFSKELKLHEPIAVQFDLRGTLQEVDLQIPELYWHGYSTLTKLSREADNLANQRQYREAIRVYNQILGNFSFEIFSDYPAIRSKRTNTFEQHFSDVLTAVNETTSKEELGLKEKIIEIEKLIPSFQYVVDSLPNPSLRITLSDSAVGALTRRARETVLSATTVRDSLQHIYDEQVSRWIIRGSLGGKSFLVFELAIKALSYTFASLNFADTTATKLNLIIPPEFKPDLTKYKILEDCEAFLRICNERYQYKMPIFPADFLTNLRKDSAAFSLPYYSILRAVNDYYYKDYASAKQEIFRIFRTANDLSINEKFDQMRILIEMNMHGAPIDALRLFQEAEQAAARNDMEAASDKYIQATVEAPDFAYGYFMLGKFFVRTGDPFRAFTFFQKAYQLDKQYLSAYRSAYTLYMRDGNYKPMIDVLTLALQNGNNYWEINSYLGQAYMGDNDPARAIQHYEKALALNPKSYQTYIHLGLAYQITKNFRRAREYFNKATELEPQRPEAVDFLRKLSELERGGK